MNQARKKSQLWSGLAALMALALALTATAASADVCLRDNYGRGVGKVPAACADAGRALDEGLCYEKCEAGYDGRGTSCVKNCPAGMKDDGALLCIKPPVVPYGVGAGYPWKIGDRVGDYEPAGVRCRQDVNNSGVGCSKEGLIWYPNCKTGFKKTGALLCAPEPVKCPEGFTDLAGSCGRPTTNRGVGIIPNACGNGKQMDSGLCYDNCKPNFAGVGPMCNQQCPGSVPVACAGAIGCASDAADCKYLFSEPVAALVRLVARDLSAAGTGVEAAIKRTLANANRTLGGIDASDWLNANAGKAGVAFAKEEVKQLKLLFDGGAFDPHRIDPKKLEAIAKSYKKAETCRN
jgi:hypothetical protein